MPTTVLLYLLLVVACAFVGGVLLKAVKQPPIIGYLLAGFILRILIPTELSHETIQFLADLGIVLLLFTLGLEFSLEKIKKVAKIAIIGGIVQILVTLIVGTLVIQWFGFELYPAIFMAAAFSLSSTAVVVKILADRGEMDSLPGEIMIGWLIIQDLAVLPLIVILPAIGKELLTGGWEISSALVLGKNVLTAFGLLFLILLLGRKIVPFLIQKIAGLGSRELLLVGVFMLAIAAAAMTQVVGLSAALGAFLAGIIIAESAQNHAVFAEIRPIRDLFALLFFATLGMLLPNGFIFDHFWALIGLTLAIMSIKFVTVLVLTAYLGYHSKTSMIVGIGLIEIGEFAFLLARIGLSEKAIDEVTYGYILSVALLSILIMPPLFLLTPSFYTQLQRFTKQKLPFLYTKLFSHLEHKETLEELPFKDHVVICGYGRVGKYVGRALSFLDIPFIVIEYDQEKATQLKKQGLQVVYGDPSDVDILDYAQVDKARAIVVAIPDLHTQKMVVDNAKKLNATIHIYCRTHHESHQSFLKELGATSLIQPEFEAALSIAHKVLKLLGHSDKIIEGKMTRLKIEHGVG